MHPVKIVKNTAQIDLNHIRALKSDGSAFDVAVH